MTSNPFLNWVIYIGSFVAAVATICAFIGKFLGPMLREEVRKMQDELRTELMAEIKEVKSSVSPNGGKSMYDAVHRIEEKQEELCKQFIQHLRDHMKDK